MAKFKAMWNISRVDLAPIQLKPVHRRGETSLRHPACPECALGMTPYSCEGTIIFKCGKCHGLWLTGRRLGLFRNALAKFDFSAFEVYLHPIDEHVYAIRSCTRCRQVLEEIPYAYNSGASLYRCERCKGLWLPLRQMIHLMKSLKIGQSVADDVRALLIEMREMDKARHRFYRIIELFRALSLRD